MSFELTVPRDITALADIQRLLASFFAASERSSPARYAIELAVEEIFTNMVRHNASGRSDIKVEIAGSEDEVVATVTDYDAPRFDPRSDGPEPAIGRPLPQRSPGGLGVYLVRQMMDQIEYSHDNRTAKVVLHKRVS